MYNSALFFKKKYFLILGKSTITKCNASNLIVKIELAGVSPDFAPNTQYLLVFEFTYIK
jgi:hypothetical protein